MTITHPRPDYGERMANLTERCVPFAELEDARSRLGAIADTTEGLGADATPWYDVVCPEWADLRTSRLYQNMPDWDTKSSCALVCRSHLRRLGARASELGLTADGIRHPYVDQTAIETIYVVGGTTNANRPGKAWVVCDTEPPPPGVIVLIGIGADAHVYVTRNGSTIEGGQVVATIPHTNPPKGYQGILRKERSYSVLGGRLHVDDGRVVVGWLDPNLLDLSADPTYDFV